MARVTLTVLFAAITVLAGPAPAGAQPRPGQRPPGQQPFPPPPPPKGWAPGFQPGIPFPVPAGEEELEDIRPYLGGLMGGQKPKDLDPKVLKELMDKLNKMPKEQQPDKAQIEKMLKDNPAFKDPEFLKQLEKMLQNPDFPKNLEGKLPKDVPIPDPDQAAGLKDKLKDVIDSGKPGGPDVGNGGDGPKIDGQLPDPGKLPEGPKNPYADNEWVKWMEKNFGSSPAAQDAVKDLLNSMQSGDMKGMFDGLPDFKGGAFGDLDKFDGPKMDQGSGWKVKPPDWSVDKGGSSWSGGGGGSSSWGGGGGPTAGGGVGLGGGGTALMVIAGVAAAIFVALMLFRRWKMDQARQAAQGAGGPGGIDLDSIRTREELVRAFDHVSLGQIGEEARSWNHRVIADEIADTRPAQAAPATELAGLYERARYAPVDEDLTPGEFADARRDLKVISGSPA